MSSARSSAARKLKAGLADAAAVGARSDRACARWCWCCCVATFFAAGGDRQRRVAAAFNWQGVVTPANYRIDAWVTPPQYTARPPVILPGLRPGEPVRASQRRAVPAGSVLVIRASGATELDVALRGGIKVKTHRQADLGDSRPRRAPKNTAMSSPSRAK